jgi:hypothetical protein
MVAAAEALELLPSLTSLAIKPAPLEFREEHVAFKGVSEHVDSKLPKIEKLHGHFNVCFCCCASLQEYPL